MKTLAVITAALLVSFSANAHQGAAGVVKERMDEMSKMKKANKQLSKLVRSSEADYLLIANLANQIAASNAATLELFPEGSLSKASEAKPSIWLNWEHFTQLVNKSERAALDLAAAATAQVPATDLKKQLELLSKTCKSCHRKYRSKK